MGFRLGVPAASIIKVSFSFSADDLAVLDQRLSMLAKAGAKARPATLLRALVHETSEREMRERTIRLTTELALQSAAEAPTVERPTVDLPASDSQKLDHVVEQLARVKIVATRTFVVRATLHASPTGRELAALVDSFLKKFPYKPRGLSKLRLELKRRG